MSEERNSNIYHVKREDGTKDIPEIAAEKAHNAWMEEVARQGKVKPGTIKCPKCGRKLEVMPEHGWTITKNHKRLQCRYCSKLYQEHPDMVPYEELPEPAKEINRVIARAAIKAMFSNKIQGQLFNIVAAIVDQCGGEVIIQEKHLTKRKIDILDFFRNPTTGDQVITLHKCEAGEEKL